MVIAYSLTKVIGSREIQNKFSSLGFLKFATNWGFFEYQLLCSEILNTFWDTQETQNAYKDAYLENGPCWKH